MAIASGLLTLTLCRTLPLERPITEGLPKHLAAGSGITQVGNTLHVIADDALDVGVFKTDSSEPGRLFPLFEGRAPLPTDHKARKKVKPDLESAAILYQDGKPYWLALGSGSTDARMTGVCVSLDKEGEPEKSVEFDLKPLYDGLKGRFTDLNIEGTAPMLEQGKLRLSQRGNSSANENALVDLDLEKAFKAAQQGKSWGPDLIKQVTPIELPTLPGSHGPVPLTITDLAPLDGSRCFFTAAAEDTDNPYDDGAIVGSRVGILEADGTISRLDSVDHIVKLEGITVEKQDKGFKAFVVTDGDNPDISASVYETWLIP